MYQENWLGKEESHVHRQTPAVPASAASSPVRVDYRRTNGAFRMVTLKIVTLGSPTTNRCGLGKGLASTLQAGFVEPFA